METNNSIPKKDSNKTMTNIRESIALLKDGYEKNINKSDASNYTEFIRNLLGKCIKKNTIISDIDLIIQDFLDDYSNFGNDEKIKLKKELEIFFASIVVTINHWTNQILSIIYGHTELLDIITTDNKKKEIYKSMIEIVGKFKETNNKLGEFNESQSESPINSKDYIKACNEDNETNNAMNAIVKTLLQSISKDLSDNYYEKLNIIFTPINEMENNEKEKEKIAKMNKVLDRMKKTLDIFSDTELKIHLKKYTTNGNELILDIPGLDKLKEEAA